jgi:hypothetical protein
LPVTRHELALLKPAGMQQFPPTARHSTGCG